MFRISVQRPALRQPDPVALARDRREVGDADQRSARRPWRGARRRPRCAPRRWPRARRSRRRRSRARTAPARRARRRSGPARGSGSRRARGARAGASRASCSWFHSRLLGDLVAHEEELLARVRPHVGVERAEVRELLPAVAGHLVQQRALAVDDLVVGQRQDEVLGEGVDEAEGQLVVVVAAVDRVASRSSRACRASSPCST